MVDQNRNLGNIHRLGAEIVDVLGEQFNQASVIEPIGRGAEREKGKSQGVDCEMSLDAIGGFVEAEPFGSHTSVARILHRL